MSKVIVAVLATLIFCGIEYIANTMGANMSYSWGVIAGLIVGIAIG